MAIMNKNPERDAARFDGLDCTPLTSLIGELDRPADELILSHKAGWTNYVEPVSRWWDAVYEVDDAAGNINCYRELDRQGIDPWNAVRSGDFDGLDLPAVLALLMWITRRERFDEGTVEDCIRNGAIVGLLRRLEALAPHPPRE